MHQVKGTALGRPWALWGVVCGGGEGQRLKLPRLGLSLLGEPVFLGCELHKRFSFPSSSLRWGRMVKPAGVVFPPPGQWSSNNTPQVRRWFKNFPQRVSLLQTVSRRVFQDGSFPPRTASALRDFCRILTVGLWWSPWEPLEDNPPLGWASAPTMTGSPRALSCRSGPHRASRRCRLSFPCSRVCCWGLSSWVGPGKSRVPAFVLLRSCGRRLPLCPRSLMDPRGAVEFSVCWAVLAVVRTEWCRPSFLHVEPLKGLSFACVSSFSVNLPYAGPVCGDFSLCLCIGHLAAHAALGYFSYCQIEW